MSNITNEMNGRESLTEDIKEEYKEDAMKEILV